MAKSFSIYSRSNQYNEHRQAEIQSRIVEETKNLFNQEWKGSEETEYVVTVEARKVSQGKTKAPVVNPDLVPEVEVEKKAEVKGKKK